MHAHAVPLEPFGDLSLESWCFSTNRWVPAGQRGRHTSQIPAHGTAAWRTMSGGLWWPPCCPCSQDTSQEQRRAKVHYAPLIRHQQLVKHRKMRKRQWLQKAYLR